MIQNLYLDNQYEINLIKNILYYEDNIWIKIIFDIIFIHKYIYNKFLYYILPLKYENYINNYLSIYDEKLAKLTLDELNEKKNYLNYLRSIII